MAASPRRETSLKVSLGDLFATRCATCGRMLVVDEVIWEAGEGDEPPTPDRAPSTAARSAATSAAARSCGTAPLDPEDVRPRRGRGRRRGGADLGAATASRRSTARRTSSTSCIALHTAAPARRPRRDHRAHRGRPARRAGPGRPAPGLPARDPAVEPAGRPRRSAAGPAHRRRPRPSRPTGDAACASATRGSPSRTAFRLVRGFVQRLEGGALGPLQARLGEDLRALGEGTATAVLAVASPSAIRALRDGALVDGRVATGAARPARPRPAADPARPGAPRDRPTTARPGCSAGRRPRCCPSTPSPSPRLRAAVVVAGRSPSAARWPRSSRRSPATAGSSSSSTAARRRSPRSAIGGASAGYRRRRRPPRRARRRRSRASSSSCRPGAALPPGPRTRANVGLPAGARRRRRPGPRPGTGPVRPARALRPAAVLGGRGRPGRHRRRGRDAPGARRAGPLRAAVRRDPRRARPVRAAPSAGGRRATARRAPTTATRRSRARAARTRACRRSRAIRSPRTPGDRTTRDRRAATSAAATTRAAPPRSPPVDRPSVEPRPTRSSGCSRLIRDELGRPDPAPARRDRAGSLVAGRAGRPGRRRAAARRPRRMGRLQPALDRRPAVRGRVLRAHRDDVHAATTCPTRRSSGPASRATAARPARPTAWSRATTCCAAARSTPSSSPSLADAGPPARHARLAGATRAGPRDHARAGCSATCSTDRERDAYLGGIGRRGRCPAPRSTPSGTSAARSRSCSRSSGRRSSASRCCGAMPASAPDDRLVRFLVVAPERTDLVRHKLERSPLLRAAMERRRLEHHQVGPPADLPGRRAARISTPSSRSSGWIRSSSAAASRCRCSAADRPVAAPTADALAPMRGTLRPDAATRPRRRALAARRGGPEPDDAPTDPSRPSTTLVRPVLGGHPRAQSDDGHLLRRRPLRRPPRGPVAGRPGQGPGAHGAHRGRGRGDPRRGPLDRGAHHPGHAPGHRRARRSRRTTRASTSSASSTRWAARSSSCPS